MRAGQRWPEGSRKRLYGKMKSGRQIKVCLSANHLKMADELASARKITRGDVIRLGLILLHEYAASGSVSRPLSEMLEQG